MLALLYFAFDNASAAEAIAVQSLRAHGIAHQLGRLEADELEAPLRRPYSSGDKEKWMLRTLPSASETCARRGP